MFTDRVLSGMRPTGSLHLGHYHGVLKNWVELQYKFDCLFFVADWHALTTHYDTPEIIEQSVWDMILDWLAAGVDPTQATFFIQSRVPAHAELHALLSMITPLSWLERIPSYRDQQKEISWERSGHLRISWLSAITELRYSYLSRQPCAGR